MKILRLLLLALAFALPPLRADLLLQPNDRVIVACEVPATPGMISVDLAAYFTMCQPIDGLQVIGLSGGQEEVEPFMHRVPTEIAAWNPNVVLTSHGMGEGHAGATGNSYTRYHPLYLSQTLGDLKKIGVRTIVLGSASVVDSTLFTEFPAKTYNDNLAAFRDLDRDLAAKGGVPFVDLYAATFDTMTKAKAGLGDSYNFGGDQGRYPQRNAQLVMAWAFLKALGATGDIGTLTVDLATNTATGTNGQKIISMQAGAVTVESTRYPYCFTDGPNYPGGESTAPLLPYFSFNDDLNRYLLLVKGVTTAKAKVTWGDTTREFTAAELAQGVNLAAAFAAHTPFDNVFGPVADALWQVQLKQLIWNDGTIAHLDDIRKMAPGSPVDALVAAIHAQDAKNLAAARAQIVPITHTLKIEPEP